MDEFCAVAIRGASEQSAHTATNRSILMQRNCCARLSSGSSWVGIESAPLTAAESNRINQGGTVKSFGQLIIAASATAMLAGCMHRGVDNVSAGDIAIDSLSATRTAILRVDNASASVARVYM